MDYNSTEGVPDWSGLVRFGNGWASEHAADELS
jgi:hypothetical protein